MNTASTDAAVLASLTETPTVSLRDLGKSLGISRTTAHKAVRRLVAAGTVTVLEVGRHADHPSRYAVK